MQYTKALTAWMCCLLLPTLVLASKICPVAGYNHVRIFTLVGPSSQYELALTVPSSLYDHYVNKDHSVYSSMRVAQFVTPYALTEISNRLRTVYTSDEDFTNAVLSIVHQLAYQEKYARYPVETLVDGWGDCDCFSYVAASILLAGGVDVVLFLYPEHMNLGVYLPYRPGAARFDRTISWYSYKGRNYYVAECTDGSPGAGWCVGETPRWWYTVETPEVVEIVSHEKSAPGRVSAQLTKLTGSTHISVTLETSPATNSLVMTSVYVWIVVILIVAIYAMTRRSEY